MRILKAVFIGIQSENIFSIAFIPKIGGKTSEIMFYIAKNFITLDTFANLSFSHSIVHPFKKSLSLSYKINSTYVKILDYQFGILIFCKLTCNDVFQYRVHIYIRAFESSNMDNVSKCNLFKKCCKTSFSSLLTSQIKRSQAEIFYLKPCQ